MSLKARIACVGAPFLLAGCISFGPEPPDSLLTLAATEPAAANAAVGTSDTSLAVGEFEAEARLAVTRVPVTMENGRVAYLQEATWVERPSRLFGRLVAETIRARSGRVVIDGDDPGVNPQDRLTGTLREFGYDARNSTVVVTVDAVRAGSGSSIATRRFAASRPGVPAEGVAVGAALNDAANEVARDIADWVASGT